MKPRSLRGDNIFHAPTLIFDRQDLSVNEKIVYIYLRRIAGTDGGPVPRIRDIGMACGIAASTVCDALKNLCRFGLIQRVVSVRALPQEKRGRPAIEYELGINSPGEQKTTNKFAWRTKESYEQSNIKELNTSVGTKTSGADRNTLRLKNPDEPVVYTGRWFSVSGPLIEHWAKVYTTCNVTDEFRRAESWLDANPKRAKKNWKRFLVNWLANASRVSVSHVHDGCPKGDPMAYKTGGLGTADTIFRRRQSW